MSRVAKAKWMTWALLGAGFGVGATYALTEDSASDVARWLLGIALTLVVVGSITWWRLLDEAQQEAHKWAWYWGGSAGLLLAAVFGAVAGRVDGTDWRAWADATSDGELVAFGVIACLMLQGLGYGVAWAGWWLRHR